VSAVRQELPTSELYAGVQRALLAGELRGEDVIARLSGESWARRRELVAALAGAGELAVPALLAALRDQRDDEARIAALVDALAASTATVEEPLFELARHASPALLADVAQILGRRRRALSLPTLVELTKHADANVAVAAIEALGRSPSHAAVDALVACVECDDFFRTYPAIDVLARTGDPRAVAPLAGLLANARYAFEAARGLGRTGDRAALAPLRALLDSSMVATLRVACSALHELFTQHKARYGSSSGLEEALRNSRSDALARRLGQTLAGSDKAEQVAICRVLGALQDGAALPWLTPLLEGAPEVAQAAEAALRALGKDAESAIEAALLEPHSARRALLLPGVGRSQLAAAVLACLDDREPQVRVLACEALARMGYSAATPRLFELLADEPRVVLAATAAIQSLGSNQTEALALAAARSDKLETRRAAMRILGYFGFASAFPLVAEAVEERDPRLRDAAIQALALIDHPGVPDLLLQLLGSSDARVRALAVRTLGEIRPSAALLAELRTKLDDPDSWVRYYACQALGKLRDEVSGERIAERLGDPAGQVRVAAIEALSHIQGELSLSSLQRAAHSEDLDVQRAALLGLAGQRDQRALPLLLGAVVSADAATRLVAISALATFGGPAVIEALAAAARDGEETVRAAAIQLLGNADDVAATRALTALLGERGERRRVFAALAVPQQGRVAALLEALKSADEQTSHALVSCLSRGQSEDARMALFSALSLDNCAARLAAAGALAALATREAYAALSRAALEDPDPEVRRVCALHLAG